MTDRTPKDPIYAMVGVLDLIAEKVGEIPNKIAAAPIPTDMDEVKHAVAQVPEKLIDLSNRLADFADQASREPVAGTKNAVEDLIDRGERVVDSLRAKTGPTAKRPGKGSSKHQGPPTPGDVWARATKKAASWLEPTEDHPTNVVQMRPKKKGADKTSGKKSAKKSGAKAGKSEGKSGAKSGSRKTSAVKAPKKPAKKSTTKQEAIKKSAARAKKGKNTRPPVL